MKAAEIPNHFNINCTPVEFDELLQGFRIYVRDYDVSTTAEEILAELEAVAANREVGGYASWTPPGWDEETDEPGTGGALVPA